MRFQWNAARWRASVWIYQHPPRIKQPSVHSAGPSSHCALNRSLGVLVWSNCCKVHMRRIRMHTRSLAHRELTSILYEICHERTNLFFPNKCISRWLPLQAKELQLEINQLACCRRVAVGQKERWASAAHAKGSAAVVYEFPCLCVAAFLEHITN